METTEKNLFKTSTKRRSPVSEDNDVLQESCNDKDMPMPSKAKKACLETVPGLVYISFLPPKMTPLHLKQIFSKYGELGRIYLQPDSKCNILYSVPLQFMFFIISLLVWSFQLTLQFCSCRRIAIQYYTYLITLS